MTTPQNQLYSLSQRIWDLYNMFKGDEEDGDIMEMIKQIELQMQEITNAQKNQENQMNLIIKLLSKDGS